MMVKVGGINSLQWLVQSPNQQADKTHAIVHFKRKKNVKQSQTRSWSQTRAIWIAKKSHLRKISLAEVRGNVSFSKAQKVSPGLKGAISTKLTWAGSVFITGM